MAVVIELNDQNSRIYRSINGIDISENERHEADLLDEKIRLELVSLEKRLVNEETLKKREKVTAYWEVGKLLVQLLDESNLKQAEAPFFFENAKLRLPESLRADDRGHKREHIKYCYRLGKYSKEMALTLKWSEWSYLFDSSSINAERRFDDWFNNALKSDNSLFDRKTVRLLGKILNSFFNKLETSDLNDSELENCYEVAKELCAILNTESQSEITTKLNILKKERVLLIQIMEGELNGSEVYKKLI